MSNAAVLSKINEEMDRRGTKRSYFDQLVDGKAPADHLRTVKQEPEDEELIEQTDSSNYSRSSSEEITPPVKRGRGRPPKSQKAMETQMVENYSDYEPEEESHMVRPVRRRVLTEKTVFTYPMILTMAIMNSPNERATATMLYDSVIYLFPCLEASVHWKNTLRHALAPKEGFLKEDPLSRSSYWSIIPDRKEGLLQSINDIIAEYKGNPKSLMMRNIDDLPFILAGTYVFPKEAGVFNMSSSNNEPRPATALEFKKALQHNKLRYALTGSPIVQSKPVDNKEVEEIPATVHVRPTERLSPQNMTKDRTVPYSVTSRPAERVSPQEMRRLKQRRVAAEGSPAGWIPYSVDPNYSNHWQPAHQPVYMYGGPESVYGAPMYEYEDEERESVTPPPNKRYVLINDTKSSVGSSSSRPRTNIFHQRRNLHQQ